VGATPIASDSEGDVGQREFWLWLAAVAFGVLLVEWWVYHRGARWPKWVPLGSLGGRFGIISSVMSFFTFP